MKFEDRFDSLIQYICNEQHFPADWLVIKAQVAQESAFRTEAISSAGCMGLMQISRALAEERLVHPEYIWCPDVNLALGIKYLKEQYDHFPEIPLDREKIRFALAAYNCGRAYVNTALRIARQDEGKTSKDIGLWQTWAYTSLRLRDKRCIWRGKRPDWAQTLRYVEKIMQRYRRYRAAINPGRI